MTPPIPPAGDDELHTTEKLARALEAENDPRLASLIERARQGHYHDFLSPLPTPEFQLMADLTALGHTALAERVKEGEFDASKAESEAWGASPEGQAAYSELTGERPATAPGPAKPASGAAFWQAQQRPQPTPSPAEAGEAEGNTVWVGSDVAADGTYIPTVHFNDDISFALNGSADRLDYAGALLTACASAEHDAAVLKQLTASMQIPQREAMKYVIRLRGRRAARSWTAGPFRLSPGISMRAEPFVSVELSGETWQWATDQAREHAQQVLEVGAIVDYDANYRDFLIEEFELDPDTAMKAVALLRKYR